MTTIDNTNDGLWEIKRGDIVVGVNLRNNDVFVLPKMNQCSLPSLKPDQVRDLRLCLQAVEKLIKEEKQRWSQQAPY